jgi:hypothetical protein
MKNLSFEGIKILIKDFIGFFLESAPSTKLNLNWLI